MDSPRRVFPWGLVSVSEEPDASVLPVQLAHDHLHRFLDDVRLFHREGRVTDHCQQSRIGLFGQGLSARTLMNKVFRLYLREGQFSPWQHGVEDGLVFVNFVEHDVDDRVGSTTNPKQVQLVKGLQQKAI